MRSNWANNYILADLKVYGQFDFKIVLLQRKPNRSVIQDESYYHTEKLSNENNGSLAIGFGDQWTAYNKM